MPNWRRVSCFIGLKTSQTTSQITISTKSIHIFQAKQKYFPWKHVRANHKTCSVDLKRMQQNIFEVAKCKLRSESLNVSCTHNFTALRDSSNKSSFHWFAVHTASQLTCLSKLPLLHDRIWYNVCFTSSLNNNSVSLHCGKYLIYIFCRCYPYLLLLFNVPSFLFDGGGWFVSSRLIKSVLFLFTPRCAFSLCKNLVTSDCRLV